MKTPRKSLLLVDITVAALAIIAMVGWILDFHILSSTLPDYPTMKFNTALCFLLCAIALSSINFGYPKSLVWVIAAVLISISGLSLIQSIFGLNFHIDELFIEDNISPLSGNVEPGRMSDATAFCFVLLGFSFCLLLNKRTELSGQYLLHLVTFLSFISMLAYLFGIPMERRQWMFTSMSINTSVAFFLISTRASLINYRLALTGIFAGRLLGNQVSRLLFPALVLASIGLSYIMIKGINSSAITPEFGATLYTASFIAIGLLLIHQAAMGLNEMDSKRVKEISERRTAEKWFKAVIEASPSAMIVVNKEGIVTLMNRQAEQLFGYNREELVGHNMKKLVPQNSRHQHPTLLSGFFQNPSSRAMGAGRTLNGVRKDGTEFPVEIGLNPVESEEGISVLASVIDISERKAKEQIEQKNRDLEIRHKELEQFNYIASHDLQEPLRTVSNYIQILEEDFQKELDQEASSHLKTINSATERMSILIKALLDYSRLDKGKTLKEISTQNTLNEVTKDLESLIMTSGTTITSENLPVLSVYPVEFRQLLQNLITNAIKFRKKEVAPMIKIHCTTENSHWTFSIADNGIGIAQEHFDRIFYIFQRLHNRKDYTGHGIGLANCKKIVEMHGGKIWVESTLNEGSIFHFTIPKNQSL